LEVSGISYNGQEVALARSITLAQIRPALPKEGVCGSLSALDFAETDVRDTLLDPMLSTKSSDEWGDAAFTAKCHNSPEQTEAILVELLERGLIELIPSDGVPSRISPRSGLPELLVAGWFGVGKKKFLPPEPGVPLEDEAREILRFIMNYTPLNALSRTTRTIEGDIGTLPYMGQWSGLQLQSWESLTWSSDDVSCMFYLFALPSCWRPCIPFTSVSHPG
jgi:hypothetical protein